MPLNRIAVARNLWPVRPATLQLEQTGQSRPRRGSQPEIMTGILLRWLGAVLLLSATVNPTGWNDIHWVRVSWAGQMPLSLILGIGLSWSILRQRLSGQASVDEIDG